jgi:hypothetical protein
MGTTSRWVVYRHTFPATGKSYVGQVKCLSGESPAAAMRRRWVRHVAPSELRAKAAQAFARALVAHGRDGWEHDVLEVMTTPRGASRAEQLWIAHLGTLAPNGYNLTAGGEGGRPAEDLTGQRFGELVVLRLHSTARDRSKRWLCRCECGCGRERIVKSDCLRHGRATRHALTLEDVRKPTLPRICGCCGSVLSRGSKGDRCRGCAMRSAWESEGYRAAVMPSRRKRSATFRSRIIEAVRSGCGTRISIARAMGLKFRADKGAPESVAKGVRELLQVGALATAGDGLLHVGGAPTV